MENNNDQATVIEFKIPPPELDPYKALERFLESSPHGLNRNVVLEYVGILASAVLHDRRATEGRGHT